MPEIEIDGQLVQAPEGATIMEVAEQLGVYIPHFCYHKKLSIAANCRMCLVQVEKAAKPVPACATPATNGMKVFTHSSLAVKAQQGVMEFLLINHPLDCPICDQGGECQLQDLAVGYGAGASHYQEEKRVVFHKDAGSLISMQEMSRCIHCTRCVRFGQEIAGVMEFGMANRTMHSEIVTFLGRSVDSELSGNMIDLCPVGALTSKPFRFAARSWELSRLPSISLHDSVGANLTVQARNHRVMRVLPRENEAVNECWISDRDRFSYEGLNSPERLTKPMIRVDGQLREVEWSVALDYAAHGLRDIVARHGADEIAALAAPWSTLEEMHLLQKVVRGLGSGNVDFRPRRYDYAPSGVPAGARWLGMRIAELNELDTALVVGSFVRKDIPLFAQRLRQAAKHNGTRVTLISLGNDDPLMAMHEHVVVAPSELPAALARVVKAAALQCRVPVPAGLEAIVPDIPSEAIATSLRVRGRSMIFLGRVAVQHPHAVQIHVLAQHLSDITGANLGFFGDSGNIVGGYLSGALPSARNARTMFTDPRRAYVMLGIEPELDCHNPQLTLAALRQADLRIVLSPFISEAMREYADVLLPVAPFTETSGTFVNAEGRVQSFKGVVRPSGEARPAWKVLRVLGNLLNFDGFDQESSEEVRDAVLPPETLIDGEFASGLDNGIKLPIDPAALVSAKGVFERVADVPIYFSDPLVRRAPALQKTRDAAPPTARMSARTLAEAGLVAGAPVRLRQESIAGSGEAVLTAALDDGVPDGCVRVSAAHPATAALGDMFGPIQVEPV
ncbi:NADH-quinone oxidoreductase subunit G [Rhodocyclus tenuis]|uniref:NADH-quinone oxidoreductase subunit NuoG n=1 Tax=Rhodocyclus gracilis TaxID=2929842 RepID=UPI0012989A26|nr:NADH-quinone oxidoreductase subunit NuoG [Rhodocyclus gracilis]MRD71961.1 NADH-quinone oxidoreductase subunit G [Rhodocyclus gracilis]